MPDCCGFCYGTGLVEDERAAAVNAEFGGAQMIRPGRCLCTVSAAEIAAVLPEMIEDIMTRVSADDEH